MPKRIVDGEGLWRSDKLARLEPRWRPEFANLLPLALANGVFEADARRVWSIAYSYNRTEITADDVAQLLDALEAAKILFRWADPSTQKTWGFWVGVNKTGRLPSQSRLKKKHDAIGPEPPAEELERFIQAIGQPMASHGLADGRLGFGFGTGTGTGTGTGNIPSSAKALSGEDGSHSVDPRHEPVRSLIQELHLKTFRVKSQWDGSEAKALDRLLKANTSWSADVICTMVRNRFGSEGIKSSRPRQWIPTLDDYAAGPLDRFGKPKAASQHAGFSKTDYTAGVKDAGDGSYVL